MKGEPVRRIRSFLRNNRGFIAFLLVFGLARTAVADYNVIPSGSMHPNILEGDVVLVNRLAYRLEAAAERHRPSPPWRSEAR